MIRTALSFDDVLLVPRYSAIESRWKDTDVTARLGDIQLDVPIISSPMDTVTGISVAAAMAKMGGLGIVHRYNKTGEQVAMARLAVTRSQTLNGPEPIVGAAVGVTEQFETRAALLVEAGARVICVDVAHRPTMNWCAAL